MEDILIPMECLFDIPSLNHMQMPDYKKGDIFMYNPYHEVHVELEEHGVFKEVDNNLCEFICKFPLLKINDRYYEVGEKITDEDIKSFEPDTLKNLYYVGYIEKRLLNKDNTKKNKGTTKKPKAKKPTSETYTMLARKLGKSGSELKKAVKDVLGIEIKDMRKKVPLKLQKQIMGALNK